jgi:hypothetical protein
MKKCDIDFILPDWGGAMVHSDPQQTDTINLSVPKKNVDIIWPKNDLNDEKSATFGNGISGNGKIAANTYNSKRDNLVIYDYEGNRLWSSGDELDFIAGGSTPMVDIKDRVIACDSKKILMVAPYDDKYKDNNWIVWKSDIHYEGKGFLIPISPTIVDGKTIVIPTLNGPVYAYDTCGSFIAEKYLGEDEITDGKYFKTINSACVNDKRVYITTEYLMPINLLMKICLGRLYAVDVYPDAPEGERLKVAWYYPFIGRSNASPLFIDDTLYFDVYQPWQGGLLEKPYVCAVTDKGDFYKEKWKVPYPKKLKFPKVPGGITWFSLTKDPRGGLWFEDHHGKKLVRFSEDDGSIIEIININDLVKDEVFGRYAPLSCMTICDCDSENPVMLVSAVSLLFKKYVLAVELEENDNPNGDYYNENNKLLWKIQIKSKHGFNYAGGQFTILKKEGDGPNRNRILFGTYWGDRVKAIGVTE